MLRTALHAVWVAVAAWLMCSSVAADDSNGPDMYVYVDISAREITLEGMRQRLALLSSGDYSVEADRALDSQIQMQIADVYVQFATTPGAHAAYGTHHAAQIDDWLNDNPDWKSRYTLLDSQFRSLSDQLSASRRAP